MEILILIFFLIPLFLIFALLKHIFKIYKFKAITGEKFYSPEGRGIYGETLTKEILERLTFQHKTFTNLYLPYKGKTVEIDIVLVTLKGIYVIESKNYSGWIYGHPIQQYWTQTLSKGKKI